MHTLLQQMTYERKEWLEDRAEVRQIVSDVVQRRQLYIPTRVFGILSPEIAAKIGETTAYHIGLQFLRNPEFYPFRMVLDRNGNASQVVDWENAELKSLKDRFGEEVQQDVLKAVQELNEWNPSARYPVIIPWNDHLNRELKSSEIISIILAQCT
jgi:hypothetical protein